MSIAGTRTIWTRGTMRTLTRTLTRTPTTTRTLATTATPRKSGVAWPVAVTVAGLSAVAVWCYVRDVRACAVEHVAMPVLRTMLDAEDAHVAAVQLAAAGLVPTQHTPVPHGERLTTRLLGTQLVSPLGLAAGCDKDALCVDAMFDTGFGIVEVGSVTPQPQPGNPRPRMFRLEQDGAVVNRYGFNSTGAAAVAARLRARVRRFVHEHGLAPGSVSLETQLDALEAGNVPRSLRNGRLLGVNVGKNRTALDAGEDYAAGVRALAPLADYVVVNVSSPNTPGLRLLQRANAIADLLRLVVDARNQLPTTHPIPIFVKLAPDIDDDELHSVAHAAADAGVDGFILGNTTIQRPSSLKSSPHLVNQNGGLSGLPLRNITPAKIRVLYEAVDGALPIIGCGGVANAHDAINMARAGASAIQLLTAFTYAGPGLPDKISRDLAQMLYDQNTTWDEIVGLDTKVGRRPSSATESHPALTFAASQRNKNDNTVISTAIPAVAVPA